ncbi:LysR family transcriptional regulator [Beijerinckia sp. L45]|uniref:LysR family transcriptional regulator n=1 Tax=Beijerinckia sp. L45 TaxID=1641855 RepID=UPI00131DA55B|nr:LysR family transcriptional regulator [Beijerinckia sp. L45]
MSYEPGWDLYRTFEAVLRHGSLSGAARTLGLTQPTVTRQIDALESALGTELFVRTCRGMSPTAVALRLQPYAETLLQTTAALVRDASSANEVSGTVRITAGETVGIEYLPPILAGLRRSHPSLHLELSLSDAVEDLMQRKADVAIRMIEPTQKTLVKEKVNTVEIGLYAHESYLDRRGMPKSLKDLTKHDIIGFDTETPVIRAVTVPYSWLRRANFAVRTDSSPAQLAIIRSGLGIGYYQSRAASQTPNLVRVLEDQFTLCFDMWIAMHENLRTNPACKIVYETLGTALAAMPDD